MKTLTFTTLFPKNGMPSDSREASLPLGNRGAHASNGAVLPASWDDITAPQQQPFDSIPAWPNMVRHA